MNSLATLQISCRGRKYQAAGNDSEFSLQLIIMVVLKKKTAYFKLEEDWHVLTLFNPFSELRWPSGN